MEWSAVQMVGQSHRAQMTTRSDCGLVNSDDLTIWTYTHLLRDLSNGERRAFRMDQNRTYPEPGKRGSRSIHNKQTESLTIPLSI